MSNYKMFHSNYGPTCISYRFRDNDISIESCKFSYPRIYNAPLRSYWNWVTSNAERPQEARMMELSDREKFDFISSRVDTVHECDRLDLGVTPVWFSH